MSHSLSQPDITSQAKPPSQTKRSTLASAVSTYMAHNATSASLTGAGGTASDATTSDQRNQLYPTDAKEYQLVGEIGRGATAVVYMANIVKSNLMVAIKRINLEKFNVNLDELLKEIQVMCKSNHENVVRFYTSFVVHHELWLVMKLLDGGSLLDVIKYTMSFKNCINGVLDEVAIASILKEVLKGLDYFHANGHIHRDVKAGNILLATDGSVKIADFGVSAFIATTRGDVTQEAMRHTFVGTPCWMAPEVMDQTPNGYDTKADIWSFGILALELATGTAPYHKYAPVKVLVMTLQNDPPTLETCEDVPGQYKHYSRTFRKMVDCCLQKVPSDRLSAKQLIKHEFFKKAKVLCLSGRISLRRVQDKQYISKHIAIPSSRRVIRSDSVEQDSGNEAPTHEDVAPPKQERHIKHLMDDDWVFDDDDEDDDDEDDVAREPLSDESQQYSTDTLQGSVDLVEKLQSLDIGNNQPRRESLPVEPEQPSHEEPKVTAATKKVRLTLRLRNQQNQLNDIKFDFDSANDTCDLVATEMVTAGLIDGVDRIIVCTESVIRSEGAREDELNAPNHRSQ